MKILDCAGGPASFTLISVDKSSVAHIPGVQVVVRGNFVGVVAPLEYDAIQAAALLKVTWSEGVRVAPSAAPSSM